MAYSQILSGSKWIDQIFKAKAVKRGGIVRRKVANVKKYATFKALKLEVKRRGFHMLRSGEQYLIFCHKGEFKVIC